MKRLVKSKRVRVFYERQWRSRPHPYWFNTKYPIDGMRRICVPFLTIDLNY